MKAERAEMFPVCTGINRFDHKLGRLYNDVPCMHRDKPKYRELGHDEHECSLYAQG